jgi:hypothetical protein
MSRRTDIEAAIAAHNSADRETLLPPDAARLLRAMFPRGSVCQRRLEDLAAEGSTEGPFPDCCAAWSMRGSCPRSYRAAFPAPTGCTCRRCGDESPLLVRRPGRQPRAALRGLRPRGHAAAGVAGCLSLTMRASAAPLSVPEPKSTHCAPEGPSDLP